MGGIEGATFTASYRFEGREYSVHLWGRDQEDAEARLRALGGGRVDGELVEEVSASKLSADDPSTALFPNEAPRYPELARAVGASWRETQSAFAELRTDWFEAVNLADPQKALGSDILRTVGRAIEGFLRVFGGRDRTREGFVSNDAEDGLLQHSILLAHAVGVARGASLVTLGRDPEFGEAQRRRILEGAFTRLSADGRLRFESRLLEIRDSMAQGFRDGANPLSIARKLGRDLDGYERGRLRTIVRTEMGIASENAIQERFRSGGVRFYTIEGDPNTDALCTSEQSGGPYLVGDTNHVPPFHPGCFCSAVAYIPETP